MTRRPGRVALVIQARMTSTRLPGKVLLPLAGEPLVRRVAERALRVAGVDTVVIAIPEGDRHRPIRTAVDGMSGVEVTEGPEDDVLHRTVAAAEVVGAETVVRITSDCPLFDPTVSSAVLQLARSLGVPYARTTGRTGFPHGFDTEVVSVSALQEAMEKADAFEREHVTPYVWRHPERFAAAYVGHQPDLRSWRLTVDTAQDYELARAVYDELWPEHPAFGLAQLAALFRRRPDLLQLNAGSTGPEVGIPA
jgi:spore coat polysaccharide biosynthesis protein SpsF